MYVLGAQVGAVTDMIYMWHVSYFSYTDGQTCAQAPNHNDLVIKLHKKITSS